MDNIEIYYFSGTGNSLHIAKELKQRIPQTTLIPFLSLLNKDVLSTNSETVGFICPQCLFSSLNCCKNFKET